MTLPDRNFAARPSVQQLKEMQHSPDCDCETCWPAQLINRPAPDAVDIPCDDSGEAEAHDPRCDCDSCQERAESQQDDLEQAQIHDIERED